MRHASVGLCLVLTGCVFDATVDAAPKITCAGIEDCPPRFVCTLGQCLPDDLPVARNARAETTEDVAVELQLEGDRAGLTFAVASAPLGTLELAADGTTHYLPPENASGTDTFTFTVRDKDRESLPGSVVINIAAANDPPTLVGGTMNTTEDVPAGFDLAVGDVDLDTVTLAVDEDPAHGLATLAGGVLFFSPAADFFGSDTVVVSATDDDGASASALVEITVAPAPDAPVVEDATFNVAEDTEARVVLEVADVDGDVDFAFQAVDAPENGVVDFDGTTLIYQPAANFTGIEQFRVTARSEEDGLVGAPAFVTIAVITVNEPPVPDGIHVVILEDQVDEPIVVSAISPDGVPVTYEALGQPSHGVLVAAPEFLSLGLVSYTPAPDYAGPDSFTFVARTGTFTALGTVTIDVQPVDDPPAVETIKHEWRLAYAEDFVLGPASDVDGESIAYSIVTAVPGASVNGNVLHYDAGACPGCPNPTTAFRTAVNVPMLADDGAGPPVPFSADLLVTSPRSCNAAYVSGARTTGRYRLLTNDGVTEYDAWCDMDFSAGGGWALAARFSAADPDWFIDGAAWTTTGPDLAANVDPDEPTAAKLGPFSLESVTEVMIEVVGDPVAAPILIDLRKPVFGESAQRKSLDELVAEGVHIPPHDPIDWTRFFDGFFVFPNSLVAEGIMPPPAFGPGFACRLCGVTNGPGASVHGVGLDGVAVGQISGVTFHPPAVRIWVRDRDFTDEFDFLLISGCGAAPLMGGSPGLYTVISDFGGAIAECPPG